MSRILKVNQSDYRVIVQSGGSITLDTGATAGTVYITGNLDVKGTTTTVESTNTTVKDNILQLNFGQIGDGISGSLGYQSGIQIERGTRSSAQLVFSEQVNHYDSLTALNKAGSFVLKTIDGVSSGLQLNTVVSTGTTDLVFDMQNSANVLSIKNTTSYEARLLPINDTTKDNFIPNRKFITDYVAASGGQAIVDKIYKLVSGVEQSRVQTFTTNIQFVVQTILKATISGNGLDVGNINIDGNTVKNSSAFNLVLTSNNNNVEVNAILNLNDQISNPTFTLGKTSLWSKAQVGPGKTGLYFTNVNNADELVAKNRALLFSMLF